MKMTIATLILTFTRSPLLPSPLLPSPLLLFPSLWFQYQLIRVPEFFSQTDKFTSDPAFKTSSFFTILIP